MSEKQTINRISEEIIAMAAVKAALSVAGVDHLTDSIADNISKMISGRDDLPAGVKVSRDKEGSPVVDVSVVVTYGSKIPQLAWDIQTAVKDAVMQIAGEKTAAVNIHVQGVVLKKAAGKKSEKKDEQKRRARACDEMRLPDGSAE